MSDPDSLPMDISIVVAMYNEALNIDMFFQRIISTLEPLNLNYEVICVNDGSTDETLPCLLKYREKWPEKVKIIILSRNFGKEIAMTAGLDHAWGRAVIPIDADLQDPPELIPKMIQQWQQGYEMVFAIRKTRAEDSWIKRQSAIFFYRLFNRVSGISMPSNTGDFRLLDQRVVAALRQMPERVRFMKGVFAWVGFKQTGIQFDRPQRYAGHSKWGYWRLWNFALDGITSFSTVPLRIWTYFGSFVAILSLCYATYLIVRTLVLGIEAPGYASIMVGILFFGGVQLITLGVLGEYIGRIYHEVKRRPLYLISSLHGLDKSHTITKSTSGRPIP